MCILATIAREGSPGREDGGGGSLLPAVCRVRVRWYRWVARKLPGRAGLMESSFIRILFFSSQSLSRGTHTHSPHNPPSHLGTLGHSSCMGLLNHSCIIGWEYLPVALAWVVVQCEG